MSPRQGSEWLSSDKSKADPSSNVHQPFVQRSIAAIKKFRATSIANENNDTYGFWTESETEYVKHLEIEHNEQLATVRKQLESASTPVEKERCEQEFRKIEEAYQSKLAELPHLLF